MINERVLSKDCDLLWLVPMPRDPDRITLMDEAKQSRCIRRGTFPRYASTTYREQTRCDFMSQAEDQDQVEQRQAVYSGVTIHNLGG